MKRLLAALSLLAAMATATAADETSPGGPWLPGNQAELHLGVGVFALFGQPDFQLAYRPARSRWIFGYRYSRIEQEFELLGEKTDESTRTLEGPNIRYLFEGTGSTRYYAEAGVYRFTYELECFVQRGSDRTRRTNFNLGGGILFDLGDSFRIDLGVTLSTRGKEPLDAGACGDDGERGDDAVASIVFVF